MNYYEDMVIIDSNLDDTAVEETVQKIKDVIVKQGGEIIKAEVWGRRKLAYELNKHQKGNYVFLVFKAPSSTIAELENLSKVVDSIIKFMVVKLTKKKQIEAAIAVPQKAAVKEAAVEAKAAETPEAAPQPEGTENV
ncbi:MAG: 30S ribosomal protein S6 [Nitrospiraceae bacterium]|nr:MAG: 30S ribosomal protein S6 [Nitrospiraceae bacterium]